MQDKAKNKNEANAKTDDQRGGTATRERAPDAERAAGEQDRRGVATAGAKRTGDSALDGGGGARRDDRPRDGRSDPDSRDETKDESGAGDRAKRGTAEAKHGSNAR